MKYFKDTLKDYHLNKILKTDIQKQLFENIDLSLLNNNDIIKALLAFQHANPKHSTVVPFQQILSVCQQLLKRDDHLKYSIFFVVSEVLKDHRMEEKLKASLMFELLSSSLYQDFQEADDFMILPSSRVKESNVSILTKGLAFEGVGLVCAFILFYKMYQHSNEVQYFQKPMHNQYALGLGIILLTVLPYLYMGYSYLSEQSNEQSYLKNFEFLNNSNSALKEVKEDINKNIEMYCSKLIKGLDENYENLSLNVSPLEKSEKKSVQISKLIVREFREKFCENSCKNKNKI